MEREFIIRKYLFDSFPHLLEESANNFYIVTAAIAPSSSASLIAHLGSFTCRAVVKLTQMLQFKELREEITDFILLKVYHTKPFDTWGINNITFGLCC